MCSPFIELESYISARHSEEGKPRFNLLYQDMQRKNDYGIIMG